jgi:hypothetical protein
MKDTKQLERAERDIKQCKLRNEIAKLPLGKQLNVYWLAIKYTWQGDDWIFAQEYALSLVKGFKQ